MPGAPRDRRQCSPGPRSQPPQRRTGKGGWVSLCEVNAGTTRAWKASPFPRDPARPPPRASLRAKSRHVAQFCGQHPHPEEGRKVRGPGPARVPPLPAAAGPPSGTSAGSVCVHGSVRGNVEPHPGDARASATAPARDGVVTPHPPRLCPQGWVAPGAGCVGSEASVSPAEGPGLGRVLPLGPESWARGRWRRGCCCGPERKPRQAPGSAAAERPARVTARGRGRRPLASSCSLLCRPSTGVAPVFSLR